MRVFTLTLLAVLVLDASPALAWDPFETSHGDVDDGNALLEEGKPGEALEAYERARESLPERAELHLNLGLAHFALGAHEQAVKALERALEWARGPLKAPALFALGSAYAAWALASEASEEERAAAPGRWAEAARHLERVLRLAPEHEGALRNLELALMRVDPPCSARDDEHEDNGDASRAALLLPPEGQQEWKIPLRLCPEDEDWFRLEIEPGDRLFASVSGADTGRRLALELRSEDGETLLRPPAGSEETLRELSFQEGTLAGQPTLRVRELDGEESAYDLTLRVLPACARMEDAQEDNDTLAQARPVALDDPEALQALRLCPQDDDWFFVDVDPYWSLLLIGSFQVEKGRPSLAVFDERGALVAERHLPPEAAPGGEDSDGAPLMLALIEPPAGRYFIRAAGSLDVESAYSLQVQVIPPCPEGDDGEEDNDSPEMAAPVEAGAPKLLRLCPGDEDWFETVAQPDAPQVASVQFDHARGDLDLELYAVDALDPLVASASSSEEQGGEALPLPEVEEETRFRLRVFAEPDVQNFYLLQVQSPEGQPQDQQQEEQQQEQDQDCDEQEEQQDQEQAEQEAPQPEPDERPQEQPRDPMEDQMDQLDHNPRNLEAERARRQSPFRHARPTRPW